MSLPRGRTAAILVFVTAIPLVGARTLLSAVQNIAAPLAGLERLARPRKSPIPDETALFSREQFEASRVTRALEETAAADPVLVDDVAGSVEVRDGGRTREFWAPLTLASLGELERELKLTPLQRERIERWLARHKELQESHVDEYGVIGQATHDAVRAELDYFQAQDFDRGWNARGYDVGIDIINRPPVGGYDIGGVGFTDIDDAGYVTREQARLEVYDLKVQTFHTLMRIDPITRAGMDSASDPVYRPASESMDLLERDLLDCLPFKGQRQITSERSTK